MRVLVTSQFSSIIHGGCEKYIHEVSKRLRESNIEILHLSSEHADFKKKQWSLFSAGFHPSWGPLIDHHIKEFKPNIIYAHLSVPAFAEISIMIAEKYKIPCILMYHSEITGTELFKRFLGLIYNITLGRMCLKYVSTLSIADFSYIHKSKLLINYLDKDLLIAPPGVSRIYANGKAVHNENYLLFVGKLDVKSKGFHYLYNAWLKARQSWPEVELWTVGSGDERKFPGIKHLGYVSDANVLSNLYASAVATVLPSTSSSESFGMVLAEALVAGCPIITTTAGGSSALVEDDVNGYCVKEKSIEQLTSAILDVRYSSSIFKKAILNKKEYYLEKFNWDTISKNIFLKLNEVSRVIKK